jgi:hypothetical protein
MRKFRRAVIIGLGGSGQKVLINLKRMLIDSFGQVPQCIQLLAFDTSNERAASYSVREGRDIKLTNNEFLHLSCQNPITFIQSSPQVQEWFIPMDVSSIVAGAQGVRQVGRIGLYANIAAAKGLLEQAFRTVNSAPTINKMNQFGWDVDQSRPAEIFISSSLAGGTGAGTFIDAAMMCRYIEPTATISGYFIMPWIYLKYPATARARGNAYAALMELEHLMNINITDGNRFKVDFGDFKGEINRPPYDLFHLIDGRNINGVVIEDPHSLASVISSGIFQTLGAIGGPADDIMVNLLKMLDRKSVV